MKKNLLFIAGALLATNAAFAQITLNQASYSSSQIRTDSFKATTAASTYPSFAAASNATWDLTTMTDTTAYNVIYRVPSTGISFADSAYFGFAGITYQGNIMSDINSTAYTQNGAKIAGNYMVLPTATTDTLFVATQNSVYVTQGTTTPQPRQVIKFPATMGSTWTNTYQSDFDYELTYTLAAYVHAPGKVKSYITETNTVIGWGKMKVKTGAGAASGLMDVLQVRTQITRVDSFYLNGGITDPLLPSLLSALFLAQGQQTITYQQNFYRANEVSPLATVTFSDAANTTPTGANTHKNRLATPVSVANVTTENGITVYPNPVTGRELNVAVEAAAGTWSYELVNIVGQSVSANTLQMNGGKATVQLSDVTPGIYFIRIANDGKQVAVRSVEVK